MLSQKAKLDTALPVTLPYWVYLPDDYHDTQQDYPLILFLHGSGERGADYEILRSHGILGAIEEGLQLPFIVVAPQCPTNQGWDAHHPALIQIVKDIAESYRVDQDRMYLTGLSMGGAGAWYLATRYPNYWAAVVPICGMSNRFGGFPACLQNITHIPVWAFHGAKDDVIPVEATEELVKALEGYGGNVKFTVYPEAGHDSWSVTYRNSELYRWMLKQEREPIEKGESA